MSSLRLGGVRINPSVVIADNNMAELNVTENGIYVPAKGYTGYAKVVVDIASKTETVNATNDKGGYASVGEKVWMNKIEGAYHIVEFAQATTDSTIGYVSQGAASGGTAKVSILVEGKDIDLSVYTYEDPQGTGDVVLKSYIGTNPDVVIPNV